MPARTVRPASLHSTNGYSHAIVKRGTPVFISGQVALNAAGEVVGKGDIAAQVDQVFNNLKGVVIAAGGSMEDIVKTTVFVTDIAFRPAVAAARKKHFRPGRYPASTFLVVSSLATPDFLVEIEAVAMIEEPS